MRFPLFLFLFSLFIFPISAQAETNNSETKTVSEEDRARVLKQMQGFSESFQRMPEVPKMNETIVLPEEDVKRD